MNLAIRDYIIHQNKEILENAMSELKKSLDFDSTAIDHLHLALYSFQDAVITVLRSHSIKPHWMFALDNLVKSAVQEGITVLSPGMFYRFTRSFITRIHTKYPHWPITELGANLAGQDRLDNIEDDNEEMSTSGVSTVNSTKLKPKKVELKRTIDDTTELKMENIRLMQDLLESHRLYQALLKSTIDEQRLNLDVLRNFSTAVTSATNVYQRSISQG